jgi:hypothetical protein
MERSLSDTGKYFMMRASKECPASVTGQGALIAKWCKEGNLSPRAVLEQLRAEPESFDFLAEIASRFHQAHGRGPIEVPLDRMRAITESSFDRAEEYMILDPEELDTIALVHYPTYHGKGRQPDELVRAAAQNLINQKRQSFLLD